MYQSKRLSDLSDEELEYQLGEAELKVAMMGLYLSDLPFGSSVPEDQKARAEHNVRVIRAELDRRRRG